MHLEHHCLPILMVDTLHGIPECASSHMIQQLIAVCNVVAYDNLVFSFIYVIPMVVRAGIELCFYLLPFRLCSHVVHLQQPAVRYYTTRVSLQPVQSC